MSEPVVEINNFYKSFDGRSVIEDLSFTVNQGEIFAFLGANGSGKTTTIRCLLNIYQPTKGELLINSRRFNVSMAAEIGYLPEERGLYTESRVLETLVHFGQLKGMTLERAMSWSIDYLKQVGLLTKQKEPISKLSSGQQQKIQLGITIINSPSLLILDEPTQGLDPVNRDLLMSALMELNQSGSTIIFITHMMEEVERIADRLVMIKDGRRKLYGNVDEVKSEFGENTIQLTFDGELPINDNLYRVSLDGNTAEIYPKTDHSTQEILDYLVSENVKIKRFEIGYPSLHEIFVRVSKEDE